MLLSEIPADGQSHIRPGLRPPVQYPPPKNQVKSRLQIAENSRKCYSNNSLTKLIGPIKA